MNLEKFEKEIEWLASVASYDGLSTEAQKDIARVGEIIGMICGTLYFNSDAYTEDEAAEMTALVTRGAVLAAAQIGRKDREEGLND